MARIDPMLSIFGLTALWRPKAPQAAAVVVTGLNADRQDAGLKRLESLPADAEAKSKVDVDQLDLDALRARVADCTLCTLCEARKQTVFGVGDTRADWMFVGEGPGASEDEQGEPFVGQAGKLLDNMLRSVGLTRERGVFIANVVKCRPPENRDPRPDEVAACEAYLKRQIALIRPRIIVALGRFAAQTLVRSDARIGALRGTVHTYEGLPVIVTYHPAYLLRSLSEKARAWEDLCLARATFAALPATPSADASASALLSAGES